MKPGDPAADVLFAFVFHGFHSLLLRRLREGGLSETVAKIGHGVDPDATPPGQCPVDAPPFMDELCIPLMDESPVELVRRVIGAARVLDVTAAEFWTDHPIWAGQNGGGHGPTR